MLQFALTIRPAKAFLLSQLLRLSASSIMQTILATKGNLLWKFDTYKMFTYVYKSSFFCESFH